MTIYERILVIAGMFLFIYAITPMVSHREDKRKEARRRKVLTACRILEAASPKDRPKTYLSLTETYGPSIADEAADIVLDNASQN